jgi:hypothetical protein
LRADGSVESESAHKATFNGNLRDVHAHNSNPVKSWVAGVNQFTDLTNEEMAEFKGLMRSSTAAAAHSVVYPSLPAGAALPDSIDWRTKGVVTPVKNQGAFLPAPSCWHCTPLLCCLAE